MSSKTLSIVALGQPEQRAVEVDVLPPGEVRLEAGARARAGRPACPAPRTSPEVGWRMPQMHLSRVDLPDPLRPRMPTVSPSLTSSETSLQGPEVLVGHRGPPWMTRSFSELYFSWYRRKRLETSRTSTASRSPLELLGEVALEPAEDDEGEEEEHGRRRARTAQVEHGVRQPMPRWGGRRTWCGFPADDGGRAGLAVDAPAGRSGPSGSSG